MRRAGGVVTIVLAVALAATALAASAPSRQTARSFSGNGGRSLPPFRLSAPSTLFWRANGGIFQIFPAGSTNNGSVNSQSSSGWTYCPPGSYALQVNAIGAWTIRIVPGAVRPKRIAGDAFEYVGSGGMTLPPFTTAHNGTLVWRSNGALFQIFSSSAYGGGDVNSQAHSGSTYLGRGTHNLQVNADGAWAIAWK